MYWTWYGWVFLGSLILGGLYALANLIKSKNEQAGELIEKFSYFQGYVGLGLIATSAWNLFYLSKDVKSLLAALPITGIVYIVSLVVGILLGILDGLEILRARNILSEETMENISPKLLFVEVPLGIIAIITGIYLVLCGIIHWKF